MQKNVIWKFDLTLFDAGSPGGSDGGAGAGPAGGGEGSGSDAGVPVADAVPTNPTRRRRENPLANVRYGKQPEAPVTQEAPAEQPAETPDDRAARWKAAKEEFRDLYSSENSELMQKRLGESKQAEEKLAKLAPMLKNMATKYGREEGDIDGIMAAYTDDDSLYEEAAAKAGIPVDIFKELEQLKGKQAERDAMDLQAEQRARFNQHYAKLHQQGEALKQTFPNFDLNTELQNQHFAHLTSPMVGMSVEDAYWTVHRRELQAASAQVAAQKSQEKLSQAIQSGMGRPSENGARSVNPGLDIRTDPRKLSKADRAEIRRRVAAGEKIYF